jgi:hypothetical protein
MEDQFWVVWQPNNGSPRVRHDSQHSAQLEAERLARANPGLSFYVLQGVSVTAKTDVVTTRLRDSVPF